MESNKDEINRLNNQIQELKLELNKRNSEINNYIEKIHDFEEELIELDVKISDNPSLDEIHKIVKSKFKFELKDKEREIRELKNNMGFLRKEKLAAQRELEHIKQEKAKSVLNVEEIRKKEQFTKELQTLESSNRELRYKLNQQETLIKNLKNELEMVNIKYEQRESLLEQLNSSLSKLKQELKIKKSIIEGRADKNIIRGVNRSLQKKVNKYKNQIEELKRRLTSPDIDKIMRDIEMRELKNKVVQLEKDLETKIKQIEELESQKVHILDR